MDNIMKAVGAEKNNMANKSGFFDASEDWHSWCRICAKADIQNINIFLKGESIRPSTESTKYNDSGLAIAIGKYFNVEMEQDCPLPIQLCTECFFLVSSLLSFNKRVIRVQQMYNELQDFGDYLKTDLLSLRLKYDVLENDWPHKFMYRSLVEVNLTEQKLKINEHIGGSLGKEPDTEITFPEPRNDVEIKKEILCEVTPLTDEDVCDYENEEAEGEDPFGSSTEGDDKESENESEDNLNNLGKTNENNIMEEDHAPVVIKISNKNKIKSRNSPKKIKKVKQTLASDSTDVCEDNDKEKPYACIECSKVFKRLSFYRTHMQRVHHKADVIPQFSCSKCPASFNTPTQLNHHFTIKHLPITERRVVPCPYCQQKFPTKTYVATHIKFVHMDERSFICEECGEAVRSKGQLKQHMLTHTDYAPFECEICKKCFKNRERLKKHLEIHNPNKHICAECGLQLNSRTTLNRHLLVHSDVMQHKCDYCGRAFKRAKALKNHLILHTGLKPYSCDFCDRTFANGSNCRSHKRKAHPEELAALEASGEKTYTKNIPKLAVLKSVTQAAENLAPVVTKQSGNFAFGKKPKLPPDGIGTIIKKPRKLHNNELPPTKPTNNQPIENNGNNNNPNQSLHAEETLSNSQSDNDNCGINNKYIPTIDNIYNQLLKQTGGYSIAPVSEFNPMNLDIKRSRSIESSPTGNSSSCIEIDITNVIAQQQQQQQQQSLSQNSISPPAQQQQLLPSVVQSCYRC